jgi:hypothetical protein
MAMSHLGAYVLSKYFAFIYVRVYSIETDLPSIALANKKNETVIDCRTGKTHEEQVMEEAEV